MLCKRKVGADQTFQEGCSSTLRSHREEKAMRILLVKPHPELEVAYRLQEGFLHLEPLELEIVAGGVPEEEVAILDLSLERRPLDVLARRLRGWLPDVVGFTGYSSNASMVKKLAGVVRAHSPSTVTVVGGIHATIVPGDYAGHAIDVIIRGEGATAFRELVRRIKKGEPVFFDGQALSERDPEFGSRVAEKPLAYPPVEQIPSPRRDLVDRSRYFCIWTSSPSGRLGTLFPRVASLRTSLGCPFSCSFCVVHHVMGGKYLQRAPEDVVSEIASLQEQYIYFLDDEMFLNQKRVARIAELLLERKILKRYISWARSDTMVKHHELFRLWRRAGLDTVYVGLESMDNSRLDGFEKRTTPDSNAKAVALCRELGITLHAAFIVDPDFTVEDFQHLAKVARDMSPAEFTFTVLSPSPGTELAEKHKSEFVCDPYRFYDCIHTLLPTRLEIRQFYRHLSDLYISVLRSNPVRMNKVRAPWRDVFRAIVSGTRFVTSVRKMYNDYPPYSVSRH